MRSWQPEPHEPVLLEWFAPLLALARRARDDEIPWPVHVDDFRLLGRFERRPRPDVWMYAHVENGGLLMCDATGNTYKYIESRSGKSRGQFRETPLRRAFWWARLPDVVQPVWYEPPARPSDGYAYEDEQPWEGDDVADEVDHSPARRVPRATTGAARRRGHLRLVVNHRDTA